MAFKVPDTPAQNPAREAEAFLRIINCLTAELPSITCSHWYRACETMRDRLSESVALTGYRPSVEVLDGGED